MADIPTPEWQPGFAMPLDEIAARMRVYTNRGNDFVLFSHGTVVIVKDGLDDAEAMDAARAVLQAIFGFHPDMNPAEMNDGNVLVQYNHPAYNLVLPDVARAHWAEVEARHMDGLVRAEVLTTPLGQNVFDDFGKMALLGRTYFFMDAQNPVVDRIVRKADQ